MSPRRRGKDKGNWPRNLYERKGYFSWRHPETREEFGLGRDQRKAFDQAIEANHKIATTAKDEPRLIHRITGDAERSVGKWNEKYQAMLALPQHGYAAVTLKSYKSLGKRMVAMLGATTPVQTIAALKVSEILETVGVTEGKARLAQALRNYMRDSFREAKVQGWFVGENPVQDTKLAVSPTVMRSRLSLEVFRRIYDATKLEWLRNAMALALVTAQRREDIAVAQFKAFHDDAWWCVQESEKSDDPHRLVIPFELRLDAFGMSLEDVVKQCRRTGVASQFLIHQTVNRGNSPIGRRIWIDTLSHRFAEAVTALDMDWAPKTPPSFHEIRSLSERLYSAQGGVNTQELLGHKEADTTAMYHDSRGSEWVRIKVGA